MLGNCAVYLFSLGVITYIPPVGTAYAIQSYLPLKFASRLLSLSGVFSLSNYKYLGLFSLGLGLSANIVFYIGMHKLCVSKLEKMDDKLLITNETYNVRRI